MPEIGVRELKVSASKIVRTVRKERTRYVITYRGRPVGLLIPLEEPLIDAETAAGGNGESTWKELMALGHEVSRRWKAGETSAELLAEIRR